LDPHAVTAAWLYACNTGFKPKWPYYVYEVFSDKAKASDKGFAFATAIATARTVCTSSGNAYGCASAYAHAQAWAKATVKAHASAWAEAVAKCKCDKTQTVAAKADGEASEFKKLVAKVEAVAKATVCVYGDDYESDEEAQTCVQDIYAHVFASVCHCSMQFLLIFVSSVQDMVGIVTLCCQ
jgi:hypothetical protein